MSNKGKKKDEVFEVLCEILHPSYEKKFKTQEDIVKYLGRNFSENFTVSQSTISRCINSPSFIKDDDGYYTISDFYYMDRYRNILKDVLSLTNYGVYEEEGEPGSFILRTDKKNDVLIGELFKKSFDFEAIVLIRINYGSVEIVFNEDKLSEDDNEFLDSICEEQSEEE